MIKKLWIKGFRNLKETVIEFSNSPVFVFGQNNQGKTNFLETFYVLRNGTSVIQSPLEDLVNFSESEAVLGIDFYSNEVPHRYYLKLTNSGTKKAILNEKEVKTFRSIKSRLWVEFISADVIRIFQESPDFRRKDLDAFCGAIFDGYKLELKKLEKMLKQKNAALKKESYDQISLWNKQIAQVATVIVEHRHEALKMLNSEINRIIQDILPEYHNNVVISYIMTRLEGDFDKETYTDHLQNKFQEDAFKEKALCYSLCGPQRDDFRIDIDNKELYSIYSRGINRTMAIVVKLAQLSLIESQTNSFPLLLLDEIFAELDNEKKKQLIPFISQKTQCIFATIQPEDKDYFDSVDVYEMKDGTLVSHG